MAISTTLRARLEVLGGRELIDLFDKIGDGAKRGFDKVDKEAAEATKEVKKLERELKALDRIARNIRASIKVDKTGVATPQQRASLDLADDIDRRTSAIRRQMEALDDVAALTHADGVRILGRQGERDLLNIRETTTGLDEVIGDGRRDGAFGDLIPDADLDRILAASERLRGENDRFFDGLGERLEAAENAEKARADREQKKAAPKRDPSTPDPVADEKKAAAEEARAKREADREERIRLAQERRAEQAANDAKRDEDYRNTLVRERQRIDDEIKRSREKLQRDLEDNRNRLQRDLDAQRTRINTERTTLNDQMARERQTFRDELARARADHVAEVDRLNRKHTADLTRLQADHQDQLRRDRSDHLRNLGAERARARAQLGRERAGFTADLARARSDHTADLARERSAFSSLLTSERGAFARRLAADQSANRTRLLAERSAHASALSSERATFARDMANERAMHVRRLAADRAEIARLNTDLQALRRAFAGINRAGRNFAGGAPGIGRAAGRLGKTFVDAARDVGRFGTALKQLESAVGRTALRTAVGGLLGVLGAGLAALGGAAALGGIAAIAALASFNAVALQNAAKSVGQSLDVFTAMKYAAGAKGVGFEDYTESLGNMREMMVGITRELPTYQKASRLFKQLQIPFRTSDGKGFADAFVVMRRLSEIVKAMPNDTIRVEFLTTLGDGTNDGLAKLLPMLMGGAAEIDAAARRAMEIGVVLTEAQVAELAKLRLEFWDMWQIVVGLSYKLAQEIMPSLIPVLKAINAWMIANEGAISDGLVATFDYLLQVTKDFWKLWNEGSDADVVIGWTATFWYVSETIIKALSRIWDGIVAGYEFAKPALTALADYFGMSGPLEAALMILAGQLLGTTALFIAVAKVGVAAVTIVTNALKNLLLPIAGRILGLVVGIVGWPLLLAAGIAALILYWDEVEKLFKWAWAEFKKTFPNTAAFLEEAFADALATVKGFTGDMLSNFHERFPELTRLMDVTRAALDSLWTSIQGLNWGLVFQGLSDVGIYLIRELANALETLSPIIEYFVKNALGSVKTILESISQYWTASKLQGEIDGQLSAELEMDDKTFKAYADMIGAGNTQVVKQYGGHPLFGSTVDQMLGRSSVQSPVSSATQLPATAAPPTRTPVQLQIDTGPTINLISESPDIAEQLSSATQTMATRSPGWNR